MLTDSGFNVDLPAENVLDKSTYFTFNVRLFISVSKVLICVLICVCVCVCLGSDRTVFPSRCFPDETTGVDLRCLCSHSRLPATTRPPNRKMSPPVLRHRPLPFLTPGPQNRHRCSRREHHTPLLYLSGTPTTRPYLSHCHARSNGQSGATAARSQRPS